MSQPHDDRKLVDFLRQHRSQPPPPTANLEDRILTTIESLPRSQRSQGYWLPTAIAASLVAGLVASRLLIPPAPSPIEVSALEAFIETSWSGTVGDSSDELTPIHDPAINTPVDQGT